MPIKPTLTLLLSLQKKCQYAQQQQSSQTATQHQHHTTLTAPQRPRNNSITAAKTTIKQIQNVPYTTIRQFFESFLVPYKPRGKINTDKKAPLSGCFSKIMFNAVLKAC
jgi:hypothetical protein